MHLAYFTMILCYLNGREYSTYLQIIPCSLIAIISIFYGNSVEIINNIDSLVLPGSTVFFNDSNAIVNYKGSIGLDNVYVSKVNPGAKQCLTWNMKKLRHVHLIMSG